MNQPYGQPQPYRQPQRMSPGFSVSGPVARPRSHPGGWHTPTGGSPGAATAQSQQDFVWMIGFEST